MVMIDDATNRTHACLFPEETTAAAMATFRGYAAKYGFPQAIYVDRDSIYETTRDATTDEELRETGPLTQFGRAMKELGVKLVLGAGFSKVGGKSALLESGLQKEGKFSDHFSRRLDNGEAEVEAGGGVVGGAGSAGAAGL
jgi:hypothetical protein